MEGTRYYLNGPIFRDPYDLGFPADCRYDIRYQVDLERPFFRIGESVHDSSELEFVYIYHALIAGNSKNVIPETDSSLFIENFLKECTFELESMLHPYGFIKLIDVYVSSDKWKEEAETLCKKYHPSGCVTLL